jgi:hypothetical protein
MEGGGGTEDAKIAVNLWHMVPRSDGYVRSP